MKKIIVLLAVLTVSAVNPVAIALPPDPGEMDISDGLSHIFDDSAYQYSFIYLDLIMSYDPGTHVEVVDGAIVNSLNAYHNATINMIGGSTENSLSLSGNAGVAMSGGLIGRQLSVSGNASATLSGGSVGLNLSAYDNARITMSGGTVKEKLNARNDAVIYLDGTDFEVTDLGGITTSLAYGDRLSDFGTIVENSMYNSFTGTITGTLADGTALNNIFDIRNTGDYVGTAEIYITPEPCTLILLGLGSLVLKKRRA